MSCSVHSVALIRTGLNVLPPYKTCSLFNASIIDRISFRKYGRTLKNLNLIDGRSERELIYRYVDYTVEGFRMIGLSGLKQTPTINQWLEKPVSYWILSFSINGSIIWWSS